MAWSIAEVARMSGVTSRTLRHYDEIGLLHPAFTGENRYRFYEHEQLLRLQQILLFRELGLSLAAIGEIMVGELAPVTALREHQRWIRDEQSRLRRLKRTVDRTLDAYVQGEGEDTMASEELFDGFEKHQRESEEVLVERFGEGVREKFAESRRNTSTWSKDDFERSTARAEEIGQKIAVAMQAGRAPNSGATQRLVAEHCAWLGTMWTPNRESTPGSASSTWTIQTSRASMRSTRPAWPITSATQ